MTPNSPEAIAFATGQNEMREADRVALVTALGLRADTPWDEALAVVRPHPWLTVATLGAEVVELRDEAAGLRRQRDELIGLGVSIHKTVDSAHQHFRGRVVYYLSRAASDAHDRSMVPGPAETQAHHRGAADALAEAACWVEKRL